MAKNYIDNLSEEVKKGHTQKAEEGYYPAVAPVGYRNTTNSVGKNVIEPDPALSQFVVKLFELYATKSYSIKTLANKIKEEGLVLNRKIHPSFVHHTLTNPIYYGDFKFRNKIYPGKHKPLIKKALWSKVQAILAERNAKPVHVTSSKRKTFNYSGFISCGQCGYAMVGE